MDEENELCANAEPNMLRGITSFLKLDEYYEIEYESGEAARLHILKDNVFRFYMSPTRTFLEYPEPMDPKDTAKLTSKSMVDYGLEAFEESFPDWDSTSYFVKTKEIKMIFDMLTGKMSIKDERYKMVEGKYEKMEHLVLLESQALSYDDNKSKQTLVQHEDEFFFGGGMQNGRFSHKGTSILIANTNNWVDGGVTSPCPFYFSTYGYGILRNTWQPGIYDFESDSVQTVHKGKDFDAFFFICEEPKDIIKCYYELTGAPILMPEFAFYEAHLNAFNRDFWVEVTFDTPNATLFEDGKYYKCYQPDEIGDKKGILESLNGEKNNYQFSARAMVDRYKKHDVPLGWFIPNDGYGSGYGQTDTLDGDIQNLKEFVDYSKSLGVEVALWTESNLHPVDPNHPKKGDRDLGKEVGVAGVVALKCDVAWIGHGYSFGLSAVEDATDIFVTKTKQKARPFIIMVDGWAGTQRYSGIWSGDQMGGEWEYIRFHIPTYIGSGLSGQPVIGSDMDGIYGGGVKEVNVRDYQWKSFTPLQLNMDGWGKEIKTPFAYDEEATQINRAYLKLKSMLMPYNYSIAAQSKSGYPMIRAMFLEFPDEKLAYTKDSQYQYMWGPNILVAPVYNDDNVNGISVRNGIFLPNKQSVWVDFFTGKQYQGGKILNNFKTPLWKIPVFIRRGAILPMCNPNNNPNEIKRHKRIFLLYPNLDDTSIFKVYEDDGRTSLYLGGHAAHTHIKLEHVDDDNIVYVKIYKTSGSYKGMIKDRKTFLQIIAPEDCSAVNMCISETPVAITKCKTEEEFKQNVNVSYFKENFVVNPYLLPFGARSLLQKAILIKIQTVDVTAEEIKITISGYRDKRAVIGVTKTSLLLKVPFALNANKITHDSITLKWEPVDEAHYYEIDRDGAIFTNIFGDTFTFNDLKFESKHVFKIRSIKDEDSSLWSETIEVTTLENPKKYIVKGVKVSSNITCESGQEVCNCDWGQDGNGKADPDERHFVTFTFDLGQVYKINKVEYVPREDATNEMILELQYRFSEDGAKWSEYSYTDLFLEHNASKSIALSRTKFRFMEIKVINSDENFGSGKEVLFYKEIA